MPFVHPLLELSDSELLSRCKRESYQGHGPGGQKRNKVHSGIRLTLSSPKLDASSCEGRSREENTKHALKHLRFKIAGEIRREIPLDIQIPFPGSEGRINNSNPQFASFIGAALDLLLAAQGKLRPVADATGLGSGSLARILRQNKYFYGKALEIRKKFGLGTLKG